MVTEATEEKHGSKSARAESNKNLEKLVSDARNALNRDLDSYQQTLAQGTADPDNFMSISQLEKALSRIQSNARETYRELTSSYLSEIDESELIQSKKGNLQKRE